MHLWDPPFCGDIDLCIKKDGSWVHEGRPIRRPAMLQLFASVLKREGDNYFLVTPVEKVGIQVEDCPFVVTEMDVLMNKGEQELRFTTNTGETVIADADHALTVTTDPESGEPHPCLHIRAGLEGLLNRAVFYRLVELAEPTGESLNQLAVRSAGEYFSLGETDSD